MTTADELREIATARPSQRRWDWTHVVERAAAQLDALTAERDQFRADYIRVVDGLEAMQRERDELRDRAATACRTPYPGCECAGCLLAEEQERALATDAPASPERGMGGEHCCYWAEGQTCPTHGEQTFDEDDDTTAANATTATEEKT